MAGIRVLDTHLINKIAAGEVVERPASVVKELCENALDAGATSVTVEVAEGGLSLIRVVDNGRGIARGETETAFLRHATSKLADADGLNRILTLGFRGEALSSVAAISKTEMLTKIDGEDLATRLTIHGGVVQGIAAAAAPRGTAISVRDLFYNTPARRKFLKKPGTESAYAADAVTKLALGRPDCAFTFINNGAEAFRTRGDGSLKNAALALFGMDVASGLLDVSYRRGGIGVTGLVCKPAVSRGNRSLGFFYINGRHIRNHVMQSAVEAAYRTRLGAGRFPVFVLNVSMPPELVDVNVHPAKLEVRFDRDVDIFKIVLGAAESAWSGAGLLPAAALSDGHKPHDIDKTPPERDSYAPPTTATPIEYRDALMPGGYSAAKPADGVVSYKTGVTSRRADSVLTVAEAFTPYETKMIKNSLPDTTYINVDRQDGWRAAFSDYRLVGQFFGTYWLIERGDGGACYLMDQHAAHERVMYDEILDKLRKGGAASQRMLEPIAVRLTPSEKQAVRENAPLLETLGFELEDMYDDNIAIRSVPYIFDRPADGSFFTGILDRLCESTEKGGGIGLYDARLEDVARIACRAAVKANDRLSEREARVLVERALKLDNPFSCPHGRPVMVEITRREIEKMFKRIT